MSDFISGRVEVENRTLSATTTVFGLLWAAHVLWHYASYASWFVSPLGFLTVCVAVVLLLRPSSTALLMSSGYLYFATWLSHLPNVPNHETLGAFAALSFVVGMSWRWITERGAPGSAARGFASSVPVIQAIVILMYFWATFHKLNRDFLFSEKASCGAVFYSTFVERFPFLPDASAFGTLGMAWGTVLVEALIGGLLLLPRTRGHGVVVGLAFHLFLTLSPKSGFYNFTSLLFALLLLFASPAVSRCLLELARAERWRQVSRVIAGAGLVALPVLLFGRFSVARTVESFAAAARTHRGALDEVLFVAWVVWSVPIFLMILQAMRRARLDPRGAQAVGPAAPKGLWIIATLFFLWGLTPYLGLKTENSFAMFSNLRTEQSDNHFLVPKALSIFDYQDDVVQVKSIRGRRADGRPLRSAIARRNYLVPYEGLRSVLRSELRSGSTIEEVVYVRNGEVVRVPYSAEGELFSQGLWQHKILTFRRFRPTGPMTCEH